MFINFLLSDLLTKIENWKKLNWIENWERFNFQKLKIKKN